MAKLPPHRLSKADRAEITRRVIAGERVAIIASDFQVTRSFVYLLKMQALDPEGARKKDEAKRSLLCKLTDSELAKFIEVISTSTPEELELIPFREKWTLDHGRQLVQRLFQKRASVRFLKEAMGPYLPKPSEFRFTKPQPPKPHHINQLDAELAKDPDFAAYYLSPLCAEIEWREYQAALADWEKRFAHEEEIEDDFKANLSANSIQNERLTKSSRTPGKRVGKHSKSKGSPFTPAKRRAKRR